MGLISDLLFGGERSSREVRHLRFTLEPVADAEVIQGQPASLLLSIKASAGAPVHIAALQFDLLNRREERRSLLERLVTQSRFIYRFTIARELAPGTELVEKIQFTPPICREGTRKTRLVTISWEITPRLLCGLPEVKGLPPWTLHGQRLEVEVHNRR
jgi:hypothetical protein